MKRFLTAGLLLALPTAVPLAQQSGAEPLVEFENMTWVEVKEALAAGRTTALFYTGGTEQRGPQNTNGGHNFMARATVKAIALKLGNAIAMPVLPYTPNNASAELPGTIGITNEILGVILERVSEQAIASGFRSVVLMGDHGGGQPPAEGRCRRSGPGPGGATRSQRAAQEQRNHGRRAAVECGPREGAAGPARGIRGAGDQEGAGEELLVESRELRVETAGRAFLNYPLSTLN